MEDRYFDLEKLENVGGIPSFDYFKAVEAGFRDGKYLQICGHGEFVNKAFALSNECNWELKEDDNGTLCLIPTKKNSQTKS